MKLSWPFQHHKNCPQSSAAGQPVLWKRDLNSVLKLCVPPRIMLYNGYAFDGIAWIFGTLCMKLSSAGIDFSPCSPSPMLFLPQRYGSSLLLYFEPMVWFLFSKAKDLFFFSKCNMFFFLFPPLLMRFPCDVKTTRKKKRYCVKNKPNLCSSFQASAVHLFSPWCAGGLKRCLCYIILQLTIKQLCI